MDERLKRDWELSRRELLRVLTCAVAGASLTVRTVAADLEASRVPREGVFELGNMQLQSGATLRNARLTYKTHGELNSTKSNAILYPTQFAAQHGDIEWLIGPGRALDPDKYFIIVLDQLGNGLSSSPNNTPPRKIACASRPSPFLMT